MPVHRYENTCKFVLQEIALSLMNRNNSSITIKAQHCLDIALHLLSMKHQTSDVSLYSANSVFYPIARPDICNSGLQAYHVHVCRGLKGGVHVNKTGSGYNGSITYKRYLP